MRAGLDSGCPTAFQVPPFGPRHCRRSSKFRPVARLVLRRTACPSTPPHQSAACCIRIRSADSRWRIASISAARRPGILSRHGSHMVDCAASGLPLREFSAITVDHVRPHLHDQCIIRFIPAPLSKRCGPGLIPAALQRPSTLRLTWGRLIIHHGVGSPACPSTPPHRGPIAKHPPIRSGHLLANAPGELQVEYTAPTELSQLIPVPPPSLRPHPALNTSHQLPPNLRSYNVCGFGVTGVAGATAAGFDNHD